MTQTMDIDTGTTRSGRSGNSLKKKASGPKRTAERAQRAAKSIVGRQIDYASTSAGNRLNATAEAIRDIGGQLRERNQGDFAGDVAQTIAGYIERVAHYLRDSDSDVLVSDLERYGRRYPAAIAGVAFATGFIGSRLVKVSSAERNLEPALPAASYES